MENASKALLIAGGILIFLLILSAGIFLYLQFSNQTKEYKEIIYSTEIQKFNSKFDVYVGRVDVTAQEIVSVINLAKEYDYQVQIYLGGSQIQFTATYTPEKFIKNNQDNSFKCVLNTLVSNANPEYDANGKITKLKFIQN